LSNNNSMANSKLFRWNLGCERRNEIN